jgi:hypothetical protein
MKKQFHKIKEIAFINNTMNAQIDGKSYSFELSQCSKKLLKAPLLIRKHYEVSSSGYGIHWPELDEDLAIDALIQKKRR